MAVGTMESLPAKFGRHFRQEEGRDDHPREGPAEQNMTKRDPAVANGNVDLTEVLHMSSGNGEASYATNSNRQGTAFRAIRHFLSRLIFESLHIPRSDGTVRIADLGCATGINTISQVGFAVQTVKALCAERRLPSPELQVFFNDLPSNDFDYLFRLLREHKLEEEYAAAAVPGSFYRLLFRSGTIHICFSMMALHWLSRVPAAVEQADSPAYNRGKVWINGGRAEVARAYAEQSKSDLVDFFRCRAEEIASGGVLFVCAMGRPNSEPPEHQVVQEGEYCGADFEAAWEDLISQGIVRAEERDSFNLPWYFPNAEEVREAIEECSAFEIRTLEVCRGVGCMSEEEFEGWVSHRGCFGVCKSNLVRSFVGSLVEQKIGSRNADALFEALQKRSAELLEKNIIRPSRFVTCIVAALRRKGMRLCCSLSLQRNILFSNHVAHVATIAAVAHMCMVKYDEHTWWKITSLLGLYFSTHV